MVKKLKRAVIKEELVALTGDFTKAVLLNQFIYWSERVKDFDKFIEEEAARMEVEGEKISIKKQNGWIYKTSEELSEETMLGLSPQTIRRHLKELIDNNWLDERENPNYKWDRTKQYRVNISKVQKDLQKLGYSLEGYPLEVEETNSDCRDDSFGGCNVQNGKSKILKWKIKDTKMENQSEQNGKAIPEITTEITSDTTIEDIESPSPKGNNNTPYKEIVQAYNDICKSLPSVRVISDKRKKKMRAIYREVGDLDVIIEAFKKAENSDFLSGRNGKWGGCNFDWLINYNNLIKTIEGTYDNRNGPQGGDNGPSNQNHSQNKYGW